MALIRSILVLLALVLAIVPAISIGAALANPNADKGSRDKDPSRGQTGPHLRLAVVPLVTLDGMIEIRCIVILAPPSVYGLRLTEGAVEQTEIKSSLGQSLPLIGGLFGEGYRPDQFGAYNRFGRAYVGGDTLLVVPGDGQDTAGGADGTVLIEDGTLDVCRPDGGTGTRSTLPVTFGGGSPLELQRIVVANQQHSFAIGGLLTERKTENAGVPVLSETPLLGTIFRRAGTAHVREERTLMILIRPTVLIQREDE